MPIFQTKRYDQILAQMVAKMVSRTGLSDVSDSSTLKHLLAAVSRAIDETYYHASLLRDLFNLDTATGEDLDERAAEIQPGSISRNSASKATVNLVFSRSGTVGSVTVPIGTRVKTAGGEEFTTTSAATITAVSPEQIPGHGVGRDSNLTSAVAAEGGADGNVASGTIIKFGSKPAGVDEVTNPSAAIGGADEESDDAFRSRLRRYIEGLARSTVSALENGVLGTQDPETGQTILFAKAVENVVDRGVVDLYVDDGTGSAESTENVIGTELSATYTWNGTTTVSSGDTSEVAVGDWILLGSDGQPFEITTITAGVSVTIANPGGLAIPTGSTTSYLNPENLCEGLAGPPPDSAVGGEEYLYLDHAAIKYSAGIALYSDQRVMVHGTDWLVEQTAGQVVFPVPLSAGEHIFARYTRYTGLVAMGQRVVDGDPSNRTDYPGLRAAGIQVIVQTPTVLVQNIEATIVVSEGYDNATAETQVTEAIKNYINGLGISGDVVRAELIQRIMGVAGIYNVNLVTPAADVVLLDDQMARTTDSNITVN